MSNPARFWFCDLRSAVIQTVGASSFIPRWNGSSFIAVLKALMRAYRFPASRFRHAAERRVIMRRGQLRQVCLDVQLEQLLQLFRVFVGRGTVITVVRPQHRDVRLDLRGEVQDHGLVRTEVRRDDRPALRLRDGPADDFQRRLGTQFCVRLRDLIGMYMV